MSDWGWRQAVAERVLALVGESESVEFVLDDVYAFEDRFVALFPKNRHVREKIRQTLQRLRDQSFLIFLGQGRYRLNLGFDDLIADTPDATDTWVVPDTKLRLRNIRLRNSLLAAHIKTRYRHACQVCRTAIELPNGKRYAEAHHLRPLGKPHLGPDTQGNILVVCPNHHVEFDRGGISVIPDSLVVVRWGRRAVNIGRKLYVEQWHRVAVNHLTYHHERIFQRGQ